MKVIAINSSPNMDKGNTAVILKPFLDGIRESGAKIEILYTKKLDIKPCQGEFNCWFKTPGECFQRDDMEIVRPKISEADIWVLATPLYVDGMTGPMKNLLDRIIPGAQPFFELRDDHIRHTGRGERKLKKKIVLVSNCGFWELDNFNPLITHIQAICKNTNMEFVGALIRPHGPALRGMLEAGTHVQDILTAATEAGRQLVRDGRISPNILNIASRELLPRDTYLQIVNERFQMRLDALEKN
jgi:multimeric flavodoxin WrbA